MFESDNQQLNQENSSNLNLQDSSDQSLQQDGSMYYMPEKFLKPQENGKGSGLFIKIGIVLLIVAVLAVGGFAIYVLKFRNADKPVDQSVLDLEKNQTNNQENQTNNLDTSQKRDEKRIGDIKNIISALSMYFADNNLYPSVLSDLSGKLSEIPVNPTPGGEDYGYQISADQKNYKLTFLLEAESKNGGLILKPGKYQVEANEIIKPYKEDGGLNENQTPNFGNPNDQGDNLDSLPVPPKGPDADNDDLTNAEEFLYGTQIDKNDTDEDTYLDGDEVLNLYDPISKTGKLVDNVNIVRVFYNDPQRYSVLYPTKWVAENKTSDYKETVFYDDKNGDFFKIQVYENPQGQTLKSWYLSFAPGVKPDDLLDFKAKTINGISTKDGLNIYFADNDKIYALSYIYTSETELNYFSTFLMFTKSFRPIK